MIVETVARLAPGAHLVARPAGVAHVYTGPLTRTGRAVPRSARPVCGARTRRLAVLPSQRRTSLDTRGTGIPRVCARCAACLQTRGRPRNKAPLVTRGDHAAAHAGLSLGELLVAAWCATSLEEMAHVGHLSLLLHGHATCTRPTVLPSGRVTTTVHDAIGSARYELQLAAGIHDERLAADHHRARAAYEAMRERRRLIATDREERIRQLGISAVKPIPARARRP